MSAAAAGEPHDFGAVIRAAQEELGRAAQVAGLSNDPLLPVLAAQGALLGATQRAVEEVREAAGTGARGLTPKGEAELIQRLSERTAYESGQAVTRIGRTMRAGVLVAAAAAGGVLAGSGFAAGRWTADERVIGIQDATFMAQIAEANGVRNLREFCQANPGPIDGDWQTCRLPPVWVHRATGPTGKKTAGGG